MRIRTVLIGIGLAGNLLLALSLFFLFNYRDTTQKSFANESLVSTYEAAWFQTLETSIDAISAWLPVTGERGNFWDPENPIYPEEELSSPDDDFANPLIQSITDKNIGEAGYLLDLMFEFDVSADGDVIDPFVLEGEPAGLFDRAAMKSIRKWIYQPPIYEGVPVQVNDVQVKLSFRVQ